MKHPRLFAVVLAAALVVTLGSAADAPELPKPTAEHEVLGQWVGTWSGSGEMKAGPFGPGGSMEWTEQCSWFAGARYHVVCKSEGTVPTGPMKGLGIMGYDPAKRVYTHYGVDNNGWSGYSEGTKSGNRWTFSSEETMDGQAYVTRFHMTMESPKRMTFSWEVSENGKDWTVMMDGVSEKN